MSAGWQSEENLVFENVLIRKVTVKAVLVCFADTSEHWIPLSVIDLEESAVDKLDIGGAGDLAVREWFCKKEKLE